MPFLHNAILLVKQTKLPLSNKGGKKQETIEIISLTKGKRKQYARSKYSYSNS